MVTSSPAAADRPAATFLLVMEEPGPAQSSRYTGGVSTIEVINSPAGKARARVVIVDDDRMILTFCQRTLGKRFEVLVFTDANDALASTDLRSAAFFLSDLQMPAMSGLDLVSRVRDLYPIIRFALMTGSDPSEPLHNEAQEHGWPILRKPFTGRQLDVFVQAQLNP